MSSWPLSKQLLTTNPTTRRQPLKLNLTKSTPNLPEPLEPSNPAPPTPYLTRLPRTPRKHYPRNFGLRPEQETTTCSLSTDIAVQAKAAPPRELESINFFEIKSETCLSYSANHVTGMSPKVIHKCEYTTTIKS